MPILEILMSLILLVIVLFLPGYFLSLAFFPKRKDLDGIERLTISFALSITILPLLVLIENQLLFIPIDYTSVVSTFLIMIIFGIAVWLIRSQRVSAPGLCHKLFPPVPLEESVPLIPKFK